jgi:hypothetical protein
MADKKGNEEEMQGELPLEDTTPDYKQQIKDLEKQRNDAQKTVKYIEKNRKTQGARVYSNDDYEKAKSKVASLEMELAEAKEAQKAEKKKNSEQKKAAIKEKVNNAIDAVATTMGANASGALTEAAINKAQGGSGSVLQTSVAGGKPQSKPIKSGSEDQQKDIKELGKMGEDVISDTLSGSENTVQDRQEALKKYLDKYIDASANSKIYNELPRTIRQAYKSGEFGDPIDEDIRKAYREEMRKPKKDRDDKVIDAYKKELERTKDARQARDWYTMNAIGTALLNVGTALKGGTPTAETAWNKRQGARIEAAQQRYKDLLDTKANAVIEDAKHLQGFNQEMEKGIRKLYADRRLQPILNELDVNSQRQLIDLMQEKAGAINFETFKSALLMSIIDNPGGAVASVFGAGKDLIDAAK